MRYKIYELVQPKVLSEIDHSDYYPQEKKRTALGEIEVAYGHGFADEHTSIENAYAEIIKHKEHLKHLTLTIIPVIDVHWDGEIN